MWRCGGEGGKLEKKVAPKRPMRTFFEGKSSLARCEEVCGEGTQKSGKESDERRRACGARGYDGGKGWCESQHVTRREWGVRSRGARHFATLGVKRRCRARAGDARESGERAERERGAHERKRGAREKAERKRREGASEREKVY